MTTTNVNRVISSWQHRIDATCVAPDLEPLKTQTIRLLAEGRPVSAQRLASVSGESIERARRLFDQLHGCGAEFDSDGNLVGLMLSLNPTMHRMRVNRRELYAWCALDTLFLPACLQQPVAVESTCPTSGVNIRLTVTPAGIESVAPAGTVVSVVVPGETPHCGRDAPSGPQGPVCSPMHFFRSRDAASTWLGGRPDIAVLTMDEAWALARTVWIEPLRQQEDVAAS